MRSAPPLGGSFNSDTFNAARIQIANSVNNYVNTQYIMQPPAFATAGLPLNVAQTRGFWGRNQNIALQKNWSSKDASASSCAGRRCIERGRKHRCYQSPSASVSMR